MMVKYGYREDEISLGRAQDLVGHGWAYLIEILFKICYYENVVIHQIKEKYGGLRFYVGGASNTVLDLIDWAERKSYEICERCGELGKPNKTGWITTLCEKCREHRKM